MSELPEGWAQSKLGEIATLRGEKTSPASVPDAPFIGLEDIEPHTSRILKVGKGSDVKSAVAMFSAGDVLYSRLRPYLNKVAVAEFDGIASAEILVMQPTEATTAEFVRRQIMTPEFLDFAALLDKGDRPRVNYPEISQFPISLPPIPEQKRIVAKVDGLTARTARARADLARIPTLIARYKQRLLALAFSGELTAGWRAGQVDQVRVIGRGEEDIQSRRASGRGDEFTAPFEIPSSWNWLKLPELGDLDRGKSRHRPRNDPRLYGGPYPFVQTGDVRAADRFLTTYSTTYSDFGLEQSRLWPIGTVCITIAANIAETAILGIEACFPDSVVGFLPDKARISSDYVEFFLRTMRDELEAYAPATAQKNINLGVLNSVRVPVPPIAEQTEITLRIESAFNWLDRMATDHAAAAKLLPKLDAAILAKAFRGELVPQDLNDEPATKLLQRVHTELKERKSSRKRIKQFEGVSYTLPPPPPEIIVVWDTRLTTGASKMTKSRQDDDVMGKPYLANLLKASRDTTAQHLFKVADLPVADFYKQLAWEIANKHIRDDDDKLEAL